MKIPKAIGAVADLLYKTRQQRLALQKEVERLAGEEAELNDHVIKTLPKSQARGVAGKLARVTVNAKDVPTVKDWDAYFEYVRKKNRFDLIQRRFNKKAVEEMLDEGEKVPGVEMFKAVTVSVNKL